MTVALMTLWILVAVTGEARSKIGGPNGQIAFNRDELDIIIANPDGTQEHSLPLPFGAEAPIWSPDGSRILVTAFRSDASERSATVDPDGTDLTVLEVPELPRDTLVRCRAWSPDGAQLLCQVQSDGDHSLDGIYSIRASDGGGLTRLTTNPFPPEGDFGGGDLPGDYSPDGTRFVFLRAKPGAGPIPDRNQSGALFVVNVDGTGPRLITPYGLANSHVDGMAHWSPDGNAILFSGEHGLLFVVYPDGTGLRRIPLDTGGGFSFAFAPDWSPDGSSIVFSLFLQEAGQVDLYTAKSDGSEMSSVTETPGEFENFANWGPHSPTA